MLVEALASVFTGSSGMISGSFFGSSETASLDCLASLCIDAVGVTGCFLSKDLILTSQEGVLACSLTLRTFPLIRAGDVALVDSFICTYLDILDCFLIFFSDGRFNLERALASLAEGVLELIVGSSLSIPLQVFLY